ncbi:hypothetical protein ABPG75_013338 [Micractinium tetrahymenae]
MQTPGAAPAAPTGGKVKSFLQGLFGSSSVCIYDVAGHHIVPAEVLSGEAEAERRRAEKGKASAPAVPPQEAEPAGTAEEPVTPEELSECMSTDTALTGATSSDAYLAEQIAAFERFQQQHRERQVAAAAAPAGSQGEQGQAQQGQSKARKIAVALAMFAGAPTLEEAVDVLVGPAAAPAAAAAAAAPGAQARGSGVPRAQLSSKSSASSLSGFEVELASLGSTSSAGCSGSSPSHAGGGAGFAEVDLAPSSSGSSAGVWAQDEPGPSGSCNRTAAWLQSHAGPCVSGNGERDPGFRSALPARYSHMIIHP